MNNDKKDKYHKAVHLFVKRTKHMVFYNSFNHTKHYVEAANSLCWSVVHCSRGYLEDSGWTMSGYYMFTLINDHCWVHSSTLNLKVTIFSRYLI